MLVAKVLELQYGRRKALVDRPHKLVHQLVVFLLADAFSSDAEIVGVVEQLFVVRADVDDDRQRRFGSNAAGGNVQRELSDADRHAVHTQIAQTEHARAIGAHNDLHIVFAPIVQQRQDVTFVIRCDLDQHGSYSTMARSQTGM